MTRRIVVVGGTGGFGRRLVEGLAATSDFHIIIAARNRERAEALALTLPSGRASAAILDVLTISAEQLAALDAFALVDATGPYQGADYRLARAAIAAGLHYLDLADARDFVAGFGILDDAAREAGVTALTGASSTPALSHAVLDRLTTGWRRVDRIAIAIVPGNRAAPRGLAVIRSIFSYAGRPVRVFDDGSWATRYGWGMLVRRDIPGLGRRWLSLCETPDLDLVPQRFAPREAALFRAGLELSLMHLGLLTLTALVRLNIMASLLPFARPLLWLATRLGGFGTDRGGMVVEVVGRDAQDQPARAVWSLVAAEGHGPYIPTLPARAALRAIAAGEMPPGAQACVGLLSLDDIEQEFAPYAISTQLVTSEIPAPFEQLLGTSFAALPAPVRLIHKPAQRLAASGLAEIRAPNTIIARVLRRLAKLPKPGRDVPVTVEFEPDRNGSEYWRRCFAPPDGAIRRYASAMAAGRKTDKGLLVERMGPLTFCHRLTATPDGVVWRLVRWRLLGLLLPAWTLPTIRCFEGADGARYTFEIDVTFPLAGPVIKYRGWLLPDR